ncbi:MAG TPA: dihydroorotate dehydrogenase (quinone), partial [Paracoccaceae bacterium]|nr:dihydroorotate dehydrogenase (quinone) [Paracoccaceae bacterium]
MTSPLEALGMIALRRLDPEAAHGMALKALQMGLGPKSGPFTSPRLATTLAGLALPNPVGLAAGYDKNAECLPALMRSGFGWLEVGAATPLPQPGNPKPRL